MPSNDTEVANEVLVLLGDAAITSLTEDTDRARALNRLYTPTLDEALRTHDWNFARMRAVLARLSAVPEFGYSFMYQLPQQPLCLRVLTTNLRADEPWEIETYITTDLTAQYRVILTDATALEIRFIARVTSPTLWDPLFADAFVHELARRAAYAITRNATLVAQLAGETTARWRTARSVDGQESRALKQLLSTSFTDVR
mgnify:CR=1 FL=1